MAKQNRIPIPKEIQRGLLVECSHKCSVPFCPEKHNLEFHHINANPSDNRKSNLVVLCPNHHAMADRGKMDRKECKFYKERLKQMVGLQPQIVKQKASTESIEYIMGSEILTPLYVDVGKIKAHLERLHLMPIGLESWKSKRNEYLFLKMKLEIQESINKFYEEVDEYSRLQERIKAVVKSKISSTFYEACEGIIVPPVNWETGEGFDTKFNDFCRETAQKICNAVVTIALRKKSISFLQPIDFGVLESPLFNLLRKDSGFAFAIRSDDPEEIDERAAIYSERFAKSVFKSIFEETLLRKIKTKRAKLIEDADKLTEVLYSEIRRT